MPLQSRRLSLVGSSSQTPQRSRRASPNGMPLQSMHDDSRGHNSVPMVPGSVPLPWRQGPWHTPHASTSGRNSSLSSEKAPVQSLVQASDCSAGVTHCSHSSRNELQFKPMQPSQSAHSELAQAMSRCSALDGSAGGTPSATQPPGPRSSAKQTESDRHRSSSALHVSRPLQDSHMSTTARPPNSPRQSRTQSSSGEELQMPHLSSKLGGRQGIGPRSRQAAEHSAVPKGVRSVQEVHQPASPLHE